MDNFESLEVVKLKKLIAAKEKYLATIPVEKQFSFQMTQSEILFLKNDILPTVQRNTSIAHDDFVKYVTKKLDKAIEHKCNGIMIYYPLNENYEDRPIIGVANVRANQRFGTFGAMEVHIDNMDGNGAKIKPINLNL